MKAKAAETSVTTTSWPTPHQRQTAKASVVKVVSERLESRIYEVFEMADEEIVEPELGARITWRDLGIVREQICGCVADDLNHYLGEYVQEILEAALTSKAEVDDRATPLVPPNRSSSRI